MIWGIPPTLTPSRNHLPYLPIGLPAMAASALVRAPATSANLGPGFDTAGLALDWWDTLEVTPDQAGPALPMRVIGEQAELIPTGAGNLVRRAMERLATAAGTALPPVRLAVVKGFPLGRGLGSSAAAVVLGLLAARQLAAPALADGELLALASELEGHPDNVAACLAGGATLSRSEGGLVRVTSLDVHPDLVALLLVAPEAMATPEARRLLPGQVPFAAAARTAGRAALLPLALAGDFDLLFEATADELHQPARLARMPATAELLERLRDRGHAACLSGAGPSLLVLAARTRLAAAEADALEALAGAAGWRLHPVEVARTGATATTT
jgi:homoserine kinase